MASYMSMYSHGYMHHVLEWEQWNIACKQFNFLLGTDENENNSEVETYLKSNQGAS